MSPTERLEQPHIDKALNDEALACQRAETLRAVRWTGCRLARRAVS